MSRLEHASTTASKPTFTNVPHMRYFKYNWQITRAYKGPLWDPAAKIAADQVAGNSNLRLGDRPRSLALIFSHLP